jgi:probable F420-dependent oxidoreductase
VKVRIGIGTGGEVEPAALDEAAAAILAHGFDSIWLPEVLSRPGPDPVVALAWLSAARPRLKLGTTMLLPGRNLLRLAKQLGTLDTLSKGRFLVTFVPGLAQGPERLSVGVPVRDRGDAIERTLPVLRRLLAGDEVDGVTLSPRPVQREFSMWLGGTAPASLERCGRLADGWLPSMCTPAEAAAGRAVIERAAADAGRVVDPEHFGLSIGYSAGDMDGPTKDALAVRAKGRDLADVAPEGFPALRSLLERHLEVGFSKFVLRPVARTGSWDEELGALADAVGDLQT